MMHGFSICHDARATVSASKFFASTVRAASIECPEAVARNERFLREQIEEVRAQLAAIEAKLPQPEAAKKAA